jgi:ribonucleoside-diphosphate reductase alpha chain
MTAKQIMSKIEPQLAQDALEIAKKQYLKIDQNGDPIESPQEMFYRVAEFMASADKKWDSNADLIARTEAFLID